MRCRRGRDLACEVPQLTFKLTSNNKSERRSPGGPPPAAAPTASQEEALTGLEGCWRISSTCFRVEQPCGSRDAGPCCGKSAAPCRAAHRRRLLIRSSPGLTQQAGRCFRRNANNVQRFLFKLCSQPAQHHGCAMNQCVTL